MGADASLLKLKLGFNNAQIKNFDFFPQEAYSFPRVKAVRY